MVVGKQLPRHAARSEPAPFTASELRVSNLSPPTAALSRHMRLPTSVASPMGMETARKSHASGPKSAPNREPRARVGNVRPTAAGTSAGPRTMSERMTPAATATRPPGRPKGSRNPPKYWMRMIPRGTMEMSGFSQILNANPMVMKVRPMPPSAERRAARGASRRTRSPTSAPRVSMIPLTKQAASPACQAASTLPVLILTGSMMRKMNTKIVGVFTP